MFYELIKRITVKHWVKHDDWNNKNKTNHFNYFMTRIWPRFFGRLRICDIKLITYIEFALNRQFHGKYSQKKTRSFILFLILRAWVYLCVWEQIFILFLKVSFLNWTSTLIYRGRSQQTFSYIRSSSRSYFNVFILYELYNIILKKWRKHC